MLLPSGYLTLPDGSFMRWCVLPALTCSEKDDPLPSARASMSSLKKTLSFSLSMPAVPLQQSMTPPPPAQPLSVSSLWKAVVPTTAKRALRTPPEATTEESAPLPDVPTMPVPNENFVGGVRFVRAEGRLFFGVVALVGVVLDAAVFGLVPVRGLAAVLAMLE
jgi:hypothetical protein